MGKIYADFISGLNRDTAKTRQSKSNISFAENIIISGTDETALGSIINTKGNTQITINPTQDTVPITYNRAGYSIIANTHIGNDIVLFYKNDTINPDTNGNDYTAVHKIDLLKYENETTYTRIEVWSGAGLNFRIDRPLSITTRYENEEIIKIYWSDGFSGMNYLNIAPDKGSTNPFAEVSYSRVRNTTLEDINRIANLDSSEVIFESFGVGKLQAGVVQYSYRYYNVNGNTTVYASPSRVIPITVGDTNSIEELRGTETEGQFIDNFANKSVNCRITVGNNAGKFDNIEIIAIQYTSNNTEPEIRIIDKRKLGNSTTIYFTDSGGEPKYGYLSVSEFYELQVDLSYKTSAIKDDRLFIGNIKEEYFDIDAEADWVGKNPGDKWDARAYRFTKLGHPTVNDRAAFLYDSSYVLGTPKYTIDGSNPNWKTLPGNSTAGGAIIPEEEDVVNAYNNIDHDVTTSDITNQAHACLYQSDGLKFGGEGINLKYEISLISGIRGRSICRLDSGVPVTVPLSLDEKSYVYGLNKGFQADEIYRFGIVFFNKKGQKSFVKWIGDIRMPSSTIITNFTGVVKGEYITPDFQLTNHPSINGEILKFKIVYVKRELYDRTVLTTGAIGQVQYKVGDHNYYTQLDPVSTWSGNMPLTYKNSLRHDSADGADRSVVEFVTPDNVFNDVSFLGGTNLKLYVKEYYKFDVSHLQAYKDTSKLRTRILRSYDNVFPTSSREIIDITSYKLVNPADNSDKENAVILMGDNFNPAGRKFINCAFADNSVTGGAGYESKHGTTLMVSTGSGLSLNSSHTLKGDIRRSTTQYGGNSYYDRLANSYIEASDYNQGNFAYATKGDITISIFEYQRLMGIYERGDHIDISETVYIPIDSVMNLNFSYGFRTLDYKNADESIWIQEDIGIHGPDTTSIIDQEIPKYLYNTVFNKVSDLDTFFSKPIDYSVFTKFNTRIRYSDLKIAGEEIDSWLSFKINNFSDLNTKYGEINQIVKFSNALIAFQESGIAQLSINPRVTQVGEDGIQTILGTGKVIDRYQYLTTDIGIQNFNQVIKSLGALYWIDINKKKVYTLGASGLFSLSDKYGLDSFFRKVLQENSNMIGVYDPYTSSVFLSIKPIDYGFIGNEPSRTIYDNTIGSIDTFGSNYRIYFYTDDINLRLGVVFKLGDAVYRVDGMNVANNPKYVILTLLEGVPPTSFPSTVDLSDFIDNRNNFTINFNEKLNVFESFHSFKPTQYIPINKNMLSTPDDKLVFSHNTGDYGMFYNNIYKSIVEVTISGKGIILNEFNNLEFFSEIRESNLNIIEHNETVNTIQVMNDYQFSDIIELLPKSNNRYETDTSSRRILTTVPNYAVLSNIRKDVEHWRTAIPRTANISVGDNDANLSDRIRSSNFKLRLGYDNTSNKGLTLHTLIVSTQEMLL